jgi:hypothetical protein
MERRLPESSIPCMRATGEGGLRQRGIWQVGIVKDKVSIIEF